MDRTARIEEIAKMVSARLQTAGASEKDWIGVASRMIAVYQLVLEENDLTGEAQELMVSAMASLRSKSEGQ